jgi:hypothetical protein
MFLPLACQAKQSMDNSQRDPQDSSSGEEPRFPADLHCSMSHWAIIISPTSTCSWRLAELRMWSYLGIFKLELANMV